VYRWTADEELVRRLRDPALAAVRWMREEADLMGNGFVSYHRRSKRGLESQSWKDSWDSMRFRDGAIALSPIAPCEVQGYAYDARLRVAELARRVWGDAGLAEQLEREAGDLRARFNRDFWVEDSAGGRYALGLDCEGRLIDSLCSNIGHLLWCGIVDEERVHQVADQLLGDDLFSGWGVRTMSGQERAFNPIGYHTGTVWPHDNSLIVAGLARQGFRQYANRITVAMIEAAHHFDHRLPEVFAGYPRSITPFPVGAVWPFDNSFIAWGMRNYGFKVEAARVAAGILDAAAFFRGRLPEAFGGYERSYTMYPVEYPTACSPQAWAAGAPILCLTEMLGLRPDLEQLTLRAEPAMPDLCSNLVLRGVPAFGRRYEVAVRGGRAVVRELA
jgi:glycogen debranching enzyme